MKEQRMEVKVKHEKERRVEKEKSLLKKAKLNTSSTGSTIMVATR